jgi:hypothetical protein
LLVVFNRISARRQMADRASVLDAEYFRIRRSISPMHDDV